MRRVPTGSIFLALTAILLLNSGTVACGENSSSQLELEPETNMPQSPDMEFQGEQEADPLAAAAMESANQELFLNRDDEHLANLHLIKRDGTIKAPAVFEVDYNSVPNFRTITHIPDRKQAFFDYLKPAIEHQNHLIKERRLILLDIQQQLDEESALLPAQETYLANMRTRYRIPEDLSREEAVGLLLRRVDSIPESMVMAQAAIESAWGTSRFARQANNFFGQWCFTPGCGLVPTSRGENDSHEVAKFTTVYQGVGAYFLHINSHPFYAKTREVREQERAEGKPPSGYTMVVGLKDYSARGNDYVKELRSMIRYNKLE
jgi:Bax protein